MLERFTLNAVVWGDQAPHLMAELGAVRMRDPWCAAVADAALAAIADGYEHHVDLVPEVVRRADGVSLDDLVMVDVQEAGGRLDGLPAYLARIAEDDERRHLGELLAGLADSLTRPGGAARVAAVLDRGLAA